MHILRFVILALVCTTSSAFAGVITLTPSSDLTQVTVGDTVTFVASIDEMAPPPDHTWFHLSLSNFRVSTPEGSSYVFDGDCADRSSLTNVDARCDGFNTASWDWVPDVPDDQQTVTGDLFSFAVHFALAGTYRLYLENAIAAFLWSGSERLDWDFTLDNPLLIHVGAVSVPEPATMGLLGLALLGVAATRIRRRRSVEV